MGRRLCAEAVEALKRSVLPIRTCRSLFLMACQLSHHCELRRDPATADGGPETGGLKVGTPFFVRYGRVKIEDQSVRSSARK